MEALNALASSLGSMSYCERNYSSSFDLVAFVFFRKFLCKVSYTLSIYYDTRKTSIDNNIS